MAIVSKIMNPNALVQMLDLIFNASDSTQKYEVYTTIDSPQIKRGESTAGDYFDLASTITGGASVVLADNVTITVSANSTGASAVTEIRLISIGTYSAVLCWVTISPEEFLYEGSITITSSTISISNTMA